MLKNLLLASLIVFCSIFSATAQNAKYKNQKAALFSYDFIITPALENKLLAFDQYITVKTQKDQSKLIAMLRHNCLELVQNNIDKTYSMSFSPINYFGSEVKYDEYGYASTSIQKAIKISQSKFFFKIYAKLDLDVPDPKQPNEEAITIDIQIKFYNKFGFEPIENFMFETAQYKVNFTPCILDDMVFYSYTDTVCKDKFKLNELMERAIFSAINQPKKK